MHTKTKISPLFTRVCVWTWPKTHSLPHFPPTVQREREREIQQDREGRERETERESKRERGERERDSKRERGGT